MRSLADNSVPHYNNKELCELILVLTKQKNGKRKAYLLNEKLCAFVLDVTLRSGEKSANGVNCYTTPGQNIIVQDAQYH